MLSRLMMARIIPNTDTLAFPAMAKASSNRLTFLRFWRKSRGAKVYGLRDQSQNVLITFGGWRDFMAGQT